MLNKIFKFILDSIISAVVLIIGMFAIFLPIFNTLQLLDIRDFYLYTFILTLTSSLSIYIS